MCEYKFIFLLLILATIASTWITLLKKLQLHYTFYGEILLKNFDNNLTYKVQKINNDNYYKYY